MDHESHIPRSMQPMVSPSSSGDSLDICYPSLSYTDSQRAREALFFQPLPPALAGGIESYLDPKYISDPSTFARLPFLPLPSNYAMFDWGFEPAFIRKRNERERQRVKCVNEGYARLREHLPQEFTEKRLSKVETLRAAIQYIKDLQTLLGVESFEGSMDKHSAENRCCEPSSNETGQEGLGERKFCKYFDEEDEKSLTSSSSSGKDEQSPTCNLENEECLGLPQTFSPKVKIEIPSPLSYYEDERSCIYQNQSSGRDYLVKGKIFCQSAHGVNSCRSSLHPSRNGCYSSYFTASPHLRNSVVTNHSTNERHYSNQSSCRENATTSALNSENSNSLLIYEESNHSKRMHNAALLTTRHSVHHNPPNEIWGEKKRAKPYLQNGCSQDPSCFKSCAKASDIYQRSIDGDSDDLKSDGSSSSNPCTSP